VARRHASTVASGGAERVPDSACRAHETTSPRAVPSSLSKGVRVLLRGAKWERAARHRLAPRRPAKFNAHKWVRTEGSRRGRGAPRVGARHVGWGEGGQHGVELDGGLSDAVDHLEVRGTVRLDERKRMLVRVIQRAAHPSISRSPSRSSSPPAPAVPELPRCSTRRSVGRRSRCFTHRCRRAPLTAEGPREREGPARTGSARSACAPRASSPAACRSQSGAR